MDHVMPVEWINGTRPLKRLDLPRHGPGQQVTLASIDVTLDVDAIYDDPST